MRKILCLFVCFVVLVGCGKERDGELNSQETPKTQEELNQEVKSKSSEVDFYKALNGGYTDDDYVSVTGQIIAINSDESLYTRLAVVTGFSDDGEVIGYKVLLHNLPTNEKLRAGLKVGDGITVYGIVGGLDEGTQLPLVSATVGEESDYQVMTEDELNQALNPENAVSSAKTEDGTYLVDYFGNPAFEIKVLGVNYTEERNQFYDGVPVESVAIIDIEGTNIGEENRYLSDSYFNFYNENGVKLSNYPVSGSYRTIEEVSPGRSAKISIAIGIDSGTKFEMDVLTDTSSKSQVIETLVFE